jgi:2-polyprenyl-6-hydroxyphenyl methylase/3-demethylubiquinone-9 3-methyltransferase
MSDTHTEFPSHERLSKAQADLFAGHAATWWEADGAFAALHRITPVRMSFIRDQVCAHFGRDPKAPKPLKGLSAIDIGCGGGLICEPLARLGVTVTGIDAVAENIATARAHADEMGLRIAYEVAAPEEMAARALKFDLVINFEVIEHVTDPASFMLAACDLVAANGAMAASTINRTVKSLALAKIGAEYVLRWVPAGTHEWRKFVKPSELARHIRGGGMHVHALNGMEFDPFRNEWKLGNDLAVNYLAFAVKS